MPLSLRQGKAWDMVEEVKARKRHGQVEAEGAAEAQPVVLDHRLVAANLSRQRFNVTGNGSDSGQRREGIDVDGGRGK
jgi:hypothetical protein